MGIAKRLVWGVEMSEATFQRTDVPYSMVLDWCEKQFGQAHRWPIGWHDPVSAHAWGHDGQRFVFANEDDCMLFVMRWA